MINIICLKWGTKYGPEYVNRLFYAIKRNTSRGFRFHCFTDDSTNISAGIIIHDLPFKNSLEGWWNKVYLFSKDLPMISAGEKIFFIDLDTLITDNIDKLLDHDPCVITVLKDFYTGLAKTVVGDDNIGSGLMGWYHGQYQHIWDEFIKDPDAAIRSVRPHGDQRWIQQNIRARIYWQDVFPGSVVSFKVHCGNGLPSDASIVCYHGTPSIPDSATKTNQSWKFVIEPQPWVLNHWKDDVLTPLDHEIKNTNQYKVRYVLLPARDIFGMVGRSGGGYNTIWTDWSDEGRKKRELIMAEYEQAMDDLCGHYRKLEESVLSEGFRNPVVITCGLPRKRATKHLPPEMRSLPPDQLLLLETTTGGSRLHVAQKYDLLIPCIVNDWAGRFDNAPEISSIEEARMCYLDQPKGLTFNPHMGLIESFDQNKIGYHLGEEWSEDRLMPLRAPIWISIMNRHGYRVDNLPKIVQDILVKAGVNQDLAGQ